MIVQEPFLVHYYCVSLVFASKHLLFVFGSTASQTCKLSSKEPSSLLTSSRSLSHSWQLSSLSSHPFCGTFYMCTFSRCSCPSPGISRKTPPCEWDERAGMRHAWSEKPWTISTRSSELIITQIHSRFDDLSEVILVGHLWGTVVFLLLPKCQTTKWHGSSCPSQGRSCHNTACQQRATCYLCGMTLVWQKSAQ